MSLRSLIQTLTAVRTTQNNIVRFHRKLFGRRKQFFRIPWNAAESFTMSHNVNQIGGHLFFGSQYLCKTPASARVRRTASKLSFSCTLCKHTKRSRSDDVGKIVGHIDLLRLTFRLVVSFTHRIRIHCRPRRISLTGSIKVNLLFPLACPLCAVVQLLSCNWTVA